MGHSVARAKPLTLADVDPENDAQVEHLEGQELTTAAERVKRAVRRHKASGIVDKKGRRVRKELPPDMRPDSKTEV